MSCELVRWYFYFYLLYLYSVTDVNNEHMLNCLIFITTRDKKISKHDSYKQRLIYKNVGPD